MMNTSLLYLLLLEEMIRKDPSHLVLNLKFLNCIGVGQITLLLVNNIWHYP